MECLAHRLQKKWSVGISILAEPALNRSGVNGLRAVQSLALKREAENQRKKRTVGASATLPSLPFKTYNRVRRIVKVDGIVVLVK